MPTIIDEAFVNKYFKNKYVHPAYNATIEMYDNLRVHFNGEYPGKLIDERRPNESEHSKDYRKKIYKPKTKATCTRITNSLSKIRRSPDWIVKFEDDFKTRIPEAESPERYINYDFPYFKSITTWLFAVCLKNYLMDANAVCAVVPLNRPVAGSNEFVKSFPLVFNSNQVIDYVEGQYAVLQSNEMCKYTQAGKEYYNGRVVIIVTESQFVRYEQTTLEGRMDPVYYYDHNIGSMPAFKLGGQYHMSHDNVTIWESRISGILPDLDEYVRMYSDFQAQLVQHVFSEKWTWGMNDQCTDCQGTGYHNNNVNVPCPTCNGTKKIKITPYSVTNVNPANTNLGQQPAPIPPLGYISKESVAEMTELLDKLLDKADYNALSAINMEFLAKVPLAESGIAKGYDRDEANNFVHAICEDLVSIADSVCYYVVEYRYPTYVPSKEERKKLLPQIAVPETYDLLNTQYLMAEMKAAQDAKMSTTFLNKMQVEIAAKKYPNDPEFIDMMECIYDLNPFPSSSIDDIVMMAQNKYITEMDAVIACNIDNFVQQAYEENDAFLDMEYADQKKIIEAMAAAKIKQNSVSDLIIPPAPPMPPSPPEPPSPDPNEA